MWNEYYHLFIYFLLNKVNTLLFKIGFYTKCNYMVVQNVSEKM